MSDWNLNGEMAIVPERAISAFNGQIDGILGTNILADFAITLDFANQQCLITYPGNLSPERAKAAGFDSRENVSIAPLSPGRLQGDYHVPVEIEGNKTPLKLDTGSLWTLLPPDYSAKLKRKPISEREVGTTQGTEPIAIFPVKSVSVDKGVVTDTTCTVLKKSGSATVLGLDFLSHFMCLIDFPGKRLYLKPAAGNASIQENDSKLIYGMTIRPNKAGEWIVTEVLDGVFKKSGVFVEDRLLQVNGLNVAGMLPEEIAQALADAIKAAITVKRGGETANRTLTIMPEK